MDGRGAGLVVVLLAGGLSSAAAVPAPRHLDAALERAGAWSAVPDDRVTVSVVADAGHGTPRALRIDWRTDLGGFTEDGLPRATQVPSAWVRLPDDVDLARFTTLRFQARMEGPRHGFLHVVVSSEARPWGEGVKALRGNVPLDAGGWQPAELSLDLAPEADRRAMRWLGFMTINVGHLPDEPDRLRTFIDDVVLGAEAPRPREGWGIESDRVVVSRLGFRPLHEKLALAHGSLAGRPFEVRRVDSGAVAFTGTLAAVESAVGRHAVADFTELTRPGTYLVRVGDRTSLPFRVGADATDHSLGLLADWCHAMRCGQATALHPACHLDDGLWLPPAGAPGPRRPRSLPLSGGWHDAGDLRTYYSYSYEMPWRLLRARDAGWARDRDADGVDDLLDGARWALRHAPRLVDPLSGGLFDKIDDRGDHRRGNHWTDGVRGTADDRRVKVEDELPRHVASLAASAGLAARRAASPEDRALAAAALELAERRLAAWVEPGSTTRPVRPARPRVDDRHGHVLARFGLGALQLHLATGKAEHLELARSCADAVLARQQARFLPGAIEPLGGDVFSWVIPHEDTDLPELFLAEMLLELPGHADAPRWRAALVRAAEWWMKPTRARWAPYSLPSLLVPDKQVPEGALAVKVAEPSGSAGARWLIPSAGRQQLADTALALQRVAQALTDPELERLARRQVHWAFGHDPFGVSWVALHDDDAIEQMYSFAQGRMAGAVAGYGLGSDGVPRTSRPGGGEPVTHAAAELLAAAIAVTEPARWSLRVVDGVRPWSGEAIVSWERTGELVARARTDSSGRLPSLALDGGQRHRLRLGEVEIPITAISGRSVTRTIDRRRLVLLEARVNEPAVRSRPFTVALTATNAGLAAVETVVRLHAEGAFALQRERRLDLEPGESETVDWPLRATGVVGPWVATFTADGAIEPLDLTGAVGTAEPAASPR